MSSIAASSGRRRILVPCNSPRSSHQQRSPRTRRPPARTCLTGIETVVGEWGRHETTQTVLLCRTSVLSCLNRRPNPRFGGLGEIRPDRGVFAPTADAHHRAVVHLALHGVVRRPGTPETVTGHALSAFEARGRRGDGVPGLPDPAPNPVGTRLNPRLANTFKSQSQPKNSEPWSIASGR